MPKTNLQQLERSFKKTLEAVWAAWERSQRAAPGETMGDGPFEGTVWIVPLDLDSDDKEELLLDMGWLQGVKVVTGWSLIRPGPREWSPRG